MNRVLVLLFGVVSFFTLDGIDRPGDTHSNLDRLPPELFGIVLDHLNNQIGTRGFINEKDIKVVLKKSRLVKLNRCR